MSIEIDDIETLGKKLAEKFDIDEKRAVKYIVRAYKKIVREKVAVKSPITGQCLYVFSRDNTHSICKIIPKSRESFCARHLNTQQAIMYKFNNE